MSRAGVTPEQRFNASVGHHLGRLIASTGRTVRDVAHESGVTERRLNRVLTGAESSYLHELVAITKACGTKPSVLLESARL